MLDGEPGESAGGLAQRGPGGARIRMLAAGVLLAALVCRGLADGGAEGDPSEEIIEGVVPWKSPRYCRALASTNMRACLKRKVSDFAVPHFF